MKQNNSVQPSEDTNIRLHVTQEEKKVFLLWLYDNYLRVNPKFCVNSIWGANRAKFIQGGSRGIRLLPC